MIMDFGQFNESINEKLSPLQQEYREYFKFMLDCYDVKSPAKMQISERKIIFFQRNNQKKTKKMLIISQMG